MTLTLSLSPSRPRSYINVASSDPLRYINVSIYLGPLHPVVYLHIYSIYSIQLALQLLIF